ncbi:MAG: hypothetical protein HKN72_06115 [Gemmatimonadetes bacterium]|nr:hypothetical protein [Gemmatimonadota bacterium]
MNPRNLTRLLLAVLTLGLAACEDATGPPGIALLLQVEVISSAAAPTGVSPARGPAPAPGIESIDIGEVALALGGLELTASTINGREDFLLEEPVVVPLRLSGDPTLALSTPVPTDEYQSIDVFVDKLDPGVPADDVLIEVFPSLEGASVLIRGTFVRDGVEELFAFSSPLSARRQYVFPAPRRFSSTFRSVALYTLTIELDGWFDAGFGELLDPTDPADQADIEANISASLELVQG